MLRKMLALLLALCLMPVAALAEDEDEGEGSLEDFEFDEVLLDDDNNIVSEDDSFYISDDEYAELLEIDMEVDENIDKGKLEINENLPDNVINILLIGIDSRSTDLSKGEQHGDVQIILSINTDDGSIKLTSIQRDLYVTIPGYKSKNRINVAYHFGQSNPNLNISGPQLAMRTINRNFEMNIQSYVTINFYGLASIVDSLGGVDLELSAIEAKAINDYLSAHPPAYDNRKDDADYVRVPLAERDGIQHLDGVQAVMYARTRHTDDGSNDFDRTERQRKLLEVLLRQVTENGIDFLKLNSLVKTTVDYVTTNVNVMEIVSLAVAVLGNDLVERAKNGEALMEQFRIPMDGTWKYDQVDGSGGKKMSVVVFHSGALDKNKKALHEFIYGEYIPAK